ncbi:serine acetyltransferase [Xanthobacter oligotrophicus]|uniref:Serine acetyltransferase n=1 Tax=Xanthobacter oligotrophicus TaxID=2607286 RepID=A0ABW7A0M6_9HYPH
MGFWQTVKADLKAATGHSRLGRLPTVFLFNPPFAAVFLHRVASHLYHSRLRRLGIAIWGWNVTRTSCHINLDAEIGPGLLLPHPAAIVIGSGVRIGANVTIYQSVTLGRVANSPIYPTVEDGAVLYTGAVIIGPVTIGKSATIGASSVVIKDVPDGGVVVGNPGRVIRIAMPADALTAQAAARP